LNSEKKPSMVGMDAARVVDPVVGVLALNAAVFGVVVVYPA
jgi:hypothetical protein